MTHNAVDYRRITGADHQHPNRNYLWYKSPISSYRTQWKGYKKAYKDAISNLHFEGLAQFNNTTSEDISTSIHHAIDLIMVRFLNNTVGRF